MPHHRRAGRIALAVALLGVMLMGGQAARADTASSITTVQALGSTAESPVIYAASTTGLYRAAGGLYASWAPQTTLTQTVTAVSPDPGHPDTVVIAATQESPYLSTVYRSVDGGRTLAPTTGASGVLAFARPAGSSSVLYAAGTDQATGYIYRSSDAGVSWTTVYSIPSNSPGTAEVTAITVDRADPAHVLAAVSVYHGGMIVESRDGGTSWHSVPDPAGTALMTPYALAISPRRPEEMWVAWGLMGTGMLAHTVDGGHRWTAVEAGLPPSPFVTAISYDTVSGRVYVDVMGQGVPHRIYASGDGAHFEQFSPGATDIGLRMTVVSRGGYIVTGDESHRLWVGSMIGALRWNVGAPFAGYYATVNAARLLGRPISPLTVCGDVPCQYFEKARLEARGHGAGTPRRAPALGRLVARPRRPPMRPLPSLPVPRHG
ncbi:MAG: hypothetical protein NVSMB65_19790 [Chloroflexota bacterium]